MSTLAFPYRYLLLAPALAATTWLSGCTSDKDETVLTVIVRADVCVKSSTPCVSMGVPKAKVDVLSGGGKTLASGATDDNGTVVLKPSETGSIRVAVASPFIIGGQKENTHLLVEGSATEVAFTAQLDVTNLTPTH